MSPQPFTHEIAAVRERVKRLLTIDAVALGKGLRIPAASRLSKFALNAAGEKTLRKQGAHPLRRSFYLAGCFEQGPLRSKLSDPRI